MVVFLTMIFGVNAQYLLQEGFEGTDVPTGWTVIDNDGDGNNWYVLNNSQSSSGGFVVHSGDGHITSASYSGSALTPDNWLITPAVNLTSNATLTFWVAGQDPNWASEHFSVYLSTTGATVADFTTTLLYDQVATGTMTQYTVNLAQYTGQTVYIAFRHHNITDMFRINLDDVEIFAQTTDPMIVANPSTINFGSILLGSNGTATSNVTAYNLTSAITATTAAPFEVSADGTTYGSTASIAAAGGTLYVKYTPTAVGTDNGTVTLSSTGATNVTVNLTGTAMECNGTVPYSYDFTSDAANQCWTVVDANNDGYTFEFNTTEGYASIRWNTAMAMDDWLISPVFALTGGETGSIDYSASSASFPEKFQMVALGATDTVALTPVINVVNTSFETVFFDLSSLSGNYQIAVHGISDADEFRLYVTNFNVYNGAPTASLTPSATSIDFGSTAVGTPTAAQEITLTTVNTNEAITLTTAAPFEISLDGTNFAATQTIPANAAMVVDDIIYVRFAPTAVGVYNQDLTIATTSLNATVALSGVGFECNVITTLPFTETFDQASTTVNCWQIVDANNDGSTYAVMAYSDDNPGCAVYFYNANNNAEDWLISPEITIPASGAFLSYDYVTSGSYEEKYSVWVIPENGTTTNAVNILPTQTVMNSDFINNMLNISSYANQTIRVAFKAESDADEYYLVFDNVTVGALGEASLSVNPTSMYFSGLVNSTTSAKVATVTAMSLTSNITITTAAPFEVSTNGSSFAATATINQADIISTDIYVRYAPTTGGTQNGTVTLTSGSLTATINVTGTAVDCSGPQALPFSEGFESDLAECWQNIDNDGDGYYWESSLDYEIQGYEGDGCYLSASYVNYVGALTPDNWLITPALAIPSAGAKLTWYVAAQDPDWAAEFYEVKLSTSPNISNFTSVFSETLQSGDWEQRTVNIDGNWAGQTVYIAFQHHNSTDKYMMKIDNINVTANVGVEDHELNATIYPNPANNVLNINANSNIDRVEVYNMMGQMVGSYNVNDVNTQISTTSFANGVYTVRISTENGMSTQKFTVAR